MPVIRAKNWPLAGRDRDWDAPAARDRIARWAGGPDKEQIDWLQYRSCFLYARLEDEGDEENLGSYLFPYVDIIDGAPHVAFRALAVTIGILNGARGGANLTAADRAGVYREAAKQYRRFDEEPPELQRSGQPALERRDYAWEELRVATEGKPTIVGYAAVFNQPSRDIGGFREAIAPGAFRKTLKETAVRALLEHDPRWILGSSRSGTLRLQEDNEGLRVEIDPPDTTAGRDVLVSLQRGDLTGMSFAFRTIREHWETKDGQPMRTLLEVALYDVSVVAYPAYPDTSVALRSAQAAGMLLQSTGSVSWTGRSDDDNATGELSEGPSLADTRVRFALLRKRLELAEQEIAEGGRP